MKLGVVIGRFQTWQLTKGHRKLIETALNENDEVLILIGDSGINPNENDPLSFQHRRLMILHSYNQDNISIFKLSDSLYCDKKWSNEIDKAIKYRINTFDEIEENKRNWQVTIYGGRDNNIEKYYSGIHPIKIIEATSGKSGTEMRKEAADYNQYWSKEFNSGCIYGVTNRFPASYSVVDIIAYTSDKHITLGKKGEAWMLPGGFVEKTDISLKEAAIRELYEETAIIAHSLNMHYLDTLIIDDPRFRKTKDFVVSTIFVTPICDICTEKVISDEFEDIRVFPLQEVKSIIVPWHLPILLRFEPILPYAK
jgi:cytidyltransferase-like protein